MLVGLVKKNGIMMVDFAVEAQRQHGNDAARRDSRSLPRPLPPDHDDDDGGAGRHAADRAGPRRRRRARQPLGLAVVGGLLVSQLLTLYITPVYYVCIEGARQRLTRPAQRAIAFPSVSRRAGTAHSRRFCPNGS